MNKMMRHSEVSNSREYKSICDSLIKRVNDFLGRA